MTTVNEKSNSNRPNAASSAFCAVAYVTASSDTTIPYVGAGGPGTMQSTSKSTCAYAAHALSILSLYAAVVSAHAHHPSPLSHPVVKRGLSTMTYQGCFSSSDGLTDQGSWTFQTSGYCQPICVNANQAVLATTGGTNCFCGDVLPPADSKVDDSKCSTPCDGYDTEECKSSGRVCVMLGLY